jgi:hypothetical protein
MRCKSEIKMMEQEKHSQMSRLDPAENRAGTLAGIRLPLAVVSRHSDQPASFALAAIV